MQLAFDPVAWEEYSWWLANDRKTLVRINKLLDDVLRNPRSGIGNLSNYGVSMRKFGPAGSLCNTDWFIE